jgi:xanthine dehydrogenase YagT iron-sulfur-binding subunit
MTPREPGRTGTAVPAVPRQATGTEESGDLGPGPADLLLTVNGAVRKVTVEPRVSLLDALRERMGVTSPKKGCNQGACGACTVHVDGRRVLSCLTLAVACAGREITTAEGLADGDELHPMQSAFRECHGLQCGYCTPGMLMAAKALLDRVPSPTREQVVEAISGNLCRCTGYEPIINAILDAAARGAGRRSA